MLWLLDISKKFKKLAALEFGPEHKWIPEEFKKYQPFKDYPSPTLIKEFCGYGLDDFRTPVIADNTQIAEKLRIVFYYIAVQAQSDLLSKIDKLYYQNDNNLQETLKQLESQVHNLRSIIRDMDDNFDPENLVIPREITLGNKKLPSGYSIFKLYNHFQKILSPHIKIPDLNSIPEFKEYSKRPKNFFIVFSTQLGDLAGISTRGITSCQNILDPEKERYWPNLVGTILSRYIGVIYLTSGTDVEGRGEKMLYRCLVRIMYYPIIKDNVLIVDKMYPSLNNDYLEQFLQALEEKSVLQVFSLDFNPNIATKLETIPEKEIPHEYESYSDQAFHPNKKEIDKLINSEDFVSREYVIDFLNSNDDRLLQLLDDKMYIVQEKAAKKINLDKFRKYINENLKNLDPNILDIFQTREDKYFAEQEKNG